MKTKKQRIRELEAQVAELLPYREKWERTLDNKRKLHERRRGLFSFFEYKNYYGIAPRFWPQVMCCDCINAVHDGRVGRKGSPNQIKIKCRIIGTRTGKFGSCNQARLKG